MDFDVGLGSFWGRSWVPLGGHFRSSWRLGRSKLVPEPSSNRLIFEKAIFHEIARFLILLGVWGPHMVPPNRPRSLQDGSLIVLDRFISILEFRFSILEILAVDSRISRFSRIAVLSTADSRISIVDSTFSLRGRRAPRAEEGAGGLPLGGCGFVGAARCCGVLWGSGCHCP